MNSTRCRWIVAEGLSRGVLKAVATGIQGDTYTRRRANGFVLDEVRKDHIAGSFFERYEWDDEVPDPTGGVISVHRVDVSRVRFRLAIDAPHLELIDPPRSTKAFATRVNEHADFKLSLVPIELGPAAWLSELESVIPSLRVLSLTSGEITVSGSVVAQIRLDGTTDVRAVARERYPATLSRLHRIAVEWGEGRTLARAELFEDGRANVAGPEGAVDAVRRALVAAISSAPGKLRGHA